MLFDTYIPQEQDLYRHCILKQVHMNLSQVNILLRRWLYQGASRKASLYLILKIVNEGQE